MKGSGREVSVSESSCSYIRGGKTIMGEARNTKRREDAGKERQVVTETAATPPPGHCPKGGEVSG